MNQRLRLGRAIPPLEEQQDHEGARYTSGKRAKKDIFDSVTHSFFPLY
jgi:hypothetical protein